MATSLYSDYCNTISEATELFSTQKGLLVLRPRPRSYCCNVLHFTVPSSCYALVTKYGADLNYQHHTSSLSSSTSSSPENNDVVVWPAGCHYPYPPWVAISHLVTKQSVVFDIDVKRAHTRDNVGVNVCVAVVFRIRGDYLNGKLVRHFVREVTPRGLQVQLKDSLEESVRSLVRDLGFIDVYGIRSVGDGDDGGGDDGGGGGDGSDGSVEDGRGGRAGKMMKKRLNEQFMSQGVEIQSVIIKSITLPRDIVQQMNEKTMVISKNAEQRMQHENEMQLVKLNEEITTMKQVALEEERIEIAAGAETMNAERMKLNDEIILAEKSVAIIREETNVKIDNILANSAFEVQQIYDEMNVTMEKVQSNAAKLCAEQLADTKLEIDTLLSQCKIQSAKNATAANQITFQAEGRMAPLLAAKHKFDMAMKQMEIFGNLAENKNLIISESTDDKLNLLTVADAIVNDDDSNKENKRNYWIAHLALINEGFNVFLTQHPSVTLKNNKPWSNASAISSLSSSNVLDQSLIEIHEFHSALHGAEPNNTSIPNIPFAPKQQQQKQQQQEQQQQQKQKQEQKQQQEQKQKQKHQQQQHQQQDQPDDYHLET